MRFHRKQTKEVLNTVAKLMSEKPKKAIAYLTSDEGNADA